jgi:hypothetical protein
MDYDNNNTVFLRLIDSGAGLPKPGEVCHG